MGGCSRHSPLQVRANLPTARPTLAKCPGPGKRHVFVSAFCPQKLFAFLTVFFLPKECPNVALSANFKEATPQAKNPSAGPRHCSGGGGPLPNLPRRPRDARGPGPTVPIPGRRGSVPAEDLWRLAPAGLRVDPLRTAAMETLLLHSDRRGPPRPPGGPPSRCGAWPGGGGRVALPRPPWSLTRRAVDTPPRVSGTFLERNFFLCVGHGF